MITIDPVIKCSTASVFVIYSKWVQKLNLVHSSIRDFSKLSEASKSLFRLSQMFKSKVYDAS